MKLDKIYFEIQNYIDKLDFSKLWSGFEPLKFALYTDDECNYVSTKLFEKFNNHETIVYSMKIRII